MTQNSYENDMDLSAIDTQIDAAGDEFDGLEPRKPVGKAPIAMLVGLVLVAGAAFLTYQLFIAGSDDIAQPQQAIVAAEPEQPPIDAAQAEEVAPEPDMMAETPVETPTLEGNAVLAEALPPESVSSETATQDASADEELIATEPAASPDLQAAHDTAQEITEPVLEPVSEVVAEPAAESAAAPQDVASQNNIAPSDVQAQAPTTPPAPPPAPAPEPPAAAALPTPATDVLTPIDPHQAANPALPLPVAAPQAPSDQKVVNTVNAVNEILGGEQAKIVQTEQRNIAKQIEVTPLAKRVIVVKKNYSAQSPQAIVAAGDRVLQAGEYNAAIEIYDRQLAKNPSDPLALAGKAEALQRAGRMQDATDTYQRLLDLNPRDLEALTNYLGLLQKQDPEQALSRLEELALQYPENAAVSGQLAMVYARQLDTPNALRAFQKAAALDATNPTYPFNLGVLYDRLGTSDKARTEYQRALRLTRDYPERASGVSVEAIRTRLGNMPY